VLTETREILIDTEEEEPWDTRALEDKERRRGLTQSR